MASSGKPDALIPSEETLLWNTQRQLPKYFNIRNIITPTPILLTTRLQPPHLGGAQLLLVAQHFPNEGWPRGW